MNARDEKYAVTAAQRQKITAPALDYRPPRVAGVPPKIGLIGCGGITKSHLTAYRDAGYDVVGLTDIQPERAEERRKEFYPDATIYDTHQELLADPAITVVDVATHPAPRAALVRDALATGKHVLSQKPFVVDLEIGCELADLADQHGVHLAVNQNGRWAPHVSYMRQAITEGLIGDVTSISTTVAWNHNWTKDTPFNDIPHLLLYDFAIHWFDMISCYMTGRSARRVFASARQLSGQEAKPPFGASVVIEFDDALATMHFDANARFGPRDQTLILGNRGTLLSQGPDLGTQTVTLTTDEGEATPDLTGSWFPDGFDGSMSELLVAIEQERPANNNARDNLNSLALAFAAMASTDIGQPIEVGSVSRMHDSWLTYRVEI
ncbi:MAG: Gfo/Idh/MocA family oxidoreductase [Planctomycetota bacterium]